MNKNIQLLLLLLFGFIITINAQDTTNTKVSTTATVVNGYYQTIDLNPNTPCGCDQKTQRTLDLAKGLRPRDVLDYKLYAFSFSFGNNTNSASKLFKAFENDKSVYKISLKEWSAFMLFTTKDFDVASFIEAAKQVFATFNAMTPEEYLKMKNTSSYNEYMLSKQEPEVK